MSASVQINDTGSTVAVTIQDAQVLVGVPTVVAHNDLTGRSASDAHPASAITNTPAGGVSATTVQTAINELDTEKAPLASPALSGVPTAPTAAPDTNTTQIATCAFAKAEADAAQAASQPLDAELTALASTTSAADKVPYFTGTGTATTADFTAAGRALVDDANAAAQLATLGIPLLATTGITGILTLSKSGTTARTATFQDADGTVPFLGTAQTWTAAQTFRAASSVRAEAAATQDAVVLAGRAGGTSSYAASITCATLSGNRTATLPDATGTIALLSVANAFTAAQSITASSAITSSSFNLLSPTLTANPASASSAAFASGNFLAQTSGAQNFTGTNGLVGLVCEADHYSSGTMADMYGARFITIARTGCGAVSSMAGASFRAQNTASITVSTAVGAYIQSATNGGGGAITTNYGLRIDDQTVGGTNYAIYTGSGIVRIGDTTDASTTSDGGLRVLGGLSIAKSIVSTASSAGAHYWGPVATDGTVRIYGNGSGQLIIEARISGTYTEVGRIG